MKYILSYTYALSPVWSTKWQWLKSLMSHQTGIITRVLCFIQGFWSQCALISWIINTNPLSQTQRDSPGTYVCGRALPGEGGWGHGRLFWSRTHISTMKPDLHFCTQSMRSDLWQPWTHIRELWKEIVQIYNKQTM